jgi:hypothetical protein
MSRPVTRRVVQEGGALDATAGSMLVQIGTQCYETYDLHQQVRDAENCVGAILHTKKL